MYEPLSRAHLARGGERLVDPTSFARAKVTNSGGCKVYMLLLELRYCIAVP